MEPDPQDSIHLLLLAWSGLTTILLTTLGVIMSWNWKTLNRRVDELATTKADKDDVDRRHKENKDTLGRIEAAIVRNNEAATESRDSIAKDVQILVGKVSNIEGRLTK